MVGQIDILGLGPHLPAASSHKHPENTRKMQVVIVEFARPRPRPSTSTLAADTR